MKNHKNQERHTDVATKNTTNNKNASNSCNPKDKSCQQSGQTNSQSWQNRSNNNASTNTQSHQQSKQTSGKDRTHEQVSGGQARDEYKHPSQNTQSKQNKMCRNNEDEEDTCKPRR